MNTVNLTCLSGVIFAVFIAVSHWIHIAATKQKIAQNLEETAEKLAQCIRFPMLNNDFLHFVSSQVWSGAVHL